MVIVRHLEAGIVRHEPGIMRHPRSICFTIQTNVRAMGETAAMWFRILNHMSKQMNVIREA